MVADRDEAPGLDRRVDRAAGVRQHEAPDAETAEHANAEDDGRRRMPLVEVGATLHHGDGNVVQQSHDERPGVADRGGARPARDVVVGDLDRFPDGVGEGPEAAAEHDPDHRLELDARADRADRLAEEVVQTVPSWRRDGIFVTIRSTASCGSSVR